MPTEDDVTYGFNREQALELVSGLGQRDFNVRLYEDGVLGGGGGGSTKFVAELNEAWTAGVAECSIYTMDGMTLTDTTEDIDVYDPLQVFAILGVGDRMYVTFQNGKYYAADNAPCPA